MNLKNKSLEEVNSMLEDLLYKFKFEPSGSSDNRAFTELEKIGLGYLSEDLNNLLYSLIDYFPSNVLHIKTNITTGSRGMAEEYGEKIVEKYARALLNTEELPSKIKMDLMKVLPFSGFSSPDIFYSRETIKFYPPNNERNKQYVELDIADGKMLDKICLHPSEILAISLINAPREQLTKVYSVNEEKKVKLLNQISPEGNFALYMMFEPEGKNKKDQIPGNDFRRQCGDALEGLWTSKREGCILLGHRDGSKLKYIKGFVISDLLKEPIMYEFNNMNAPKSLRFLDEIFTAVLLIKEYQKAPHAGINVYKGRELIDKIK